MDDSNNKIIVYSTPNCISCNKVKTLLNKYNIKYKIVNVVESDATLEKFLQKIGQTSVPVTEIDGKFIVGYQEGEIKRLIGV